MNTKFYSLTKRGGQIVFCVTLAFVFMLPSCSKDDAVAANVKPETSEERIERRLKELKALGKTITIEHSTLDEINLLMKQEGLPEISEKEVEASLQTRTIYPCEVWAAHGDWNQNGAFTAWDLVLARKYLCNYPGSGGCQGEINILQGQHPVVAIDFAYLSLLAGSYDDHLLNSDDITYGQNLILGLISCN